jgi:hypothetical protein
MRQKEGGEVDLLWTTYEELIENKKLLIERILKWYGLERCIPHIDSAISVVSKKRSGNRYNNGVKGRGEYMLSDSQKERIRSMANYYPRWILEGWDYNENNKQEDLLKLCPCYQ